MSGTVVAVDLGASSGRVMLGRVGHGELAIRPIARFPNLPVRTPDGLHWNILELYRNALAGLRGAFREEPSIASVAVDSWAVDYALVRNGTMVGTPFHYRDERNLPAVAAVHSRVGPAQLYAANGLQHLPFNTLFQLTADRDAGMLEVADGFLLIPDLIGYWLTGERFAEVTNASTTGLLSFNGGGWDDALIDRLGLPRLIFPGLISPGTRLGGLLPHVASEVGGQTAVTATGSHDTASAVVAVPATGENFAYISCGTWGLVGVELDAPVLTEAGRIAGFTNEVGVDGRVRYLHNVMGLWLLNESLRRWQRQDPQLALDRVLSEASALASPVAIFDANDERFLTAGDIPGRIAAWCHERGLEAPGTPAEFTRSIIESIAVAFTDAVRRVGELSGRPVAVIHLVGGGSQITLLCQLTADRSGIPVLAGPVEATAIGNVLVQARTAGLASGSLEALRALVATAFPPTRFLPRKSSGVLPRG